MVKHVANTRLAAEIYHKNYLLSLLPKEVEIVALRKKIVERKILFRLLIIKRFYCLDLPRFYLSI
jgi:hypothetical protein